MNSIVNASTALFHPSTEIERRFNEGLAGRMLSFQFSESELVPTHTNGTRTDSSPICNTTEGSGITSGTATVITTGAAGTCTAGDIFTIAGVYAVNPETKSAYAHLQQFVITTAHTNDATDTWAVSPTPITSGAKQNISIPVPAASQAVVFVAAGGSGTASAADRVNLAYHKDAFTMVTADLIMPDGVDFKARDVLDGISMRTIRQYDINNDRLPTRIDVLYGYKTVRPEWACRLPG